MGSAHDRDVLDLDVAALLAVADQRTAQDIFDGLAQDYPGNPHRGPGQDEIGVGGGADATDNIHVIHVIRVNADPTHTFDVPLGQELGGTDSRHVAQAADPNNPFTGNGWTGRRNPVPEVTGGWRVDASGNRARVGVDKTIDGELQWVRR